jgi:glycosyltransferase involved in cell wall biosynthesis
MDIVLHQPLVSVGVPTYNRPQSLRRTLECITNQSYKNLEIIISDNCSPGTETQDVVNEFVNKDSRIKYYRQDVNKGAAFNFKFLLEKATGEYFAWMADDDEWDKFFIEKCLSHIKTCTSAMCKIKCGFKERGVAYESHLPDISLNYSKYRNYKESILNPVPGIIYGLHKRCDIIWLLDTDIFDFSDCFFVSKVCVQGNGLSLIADYTGFQSNIYRSERYQYKPFEPADDRLFQYKPFIRHHMNLIAESQFSFFQKQLLKLIVLWRTGKWYTKFEKKYKPLRVWLIKIIMRLVRSLLKLQKIWLLFKSGKQT